MSVCQHQNLARSIPGLVCRDCRFKAASRGENCPMHVSRYLEMLGSSLAGCLDRLKKAEQALKTLERSPCVDCGRWGLSEIGLEMYWLGESRMVCKDCAHRHNVCEQHKAHVSLCELAHCTHEEEA
jgi:hypothetical protein